MPPDADVRVRARVSVSGEGYAAQVDVESSAGETRRDLESPDCTTLLDAVALIAQAAVTEAEQAEDRESGDAVEGELVPMARPRVAANETHTPKPAPPRPAPAPEPTPSRSTLPELAVSPYLRATGRIGWALTPVLDGGGSLALGLQWKRLRVEATGDLLVPTEERVPETESGVIRVFAWTAGVRGCGIAWTDAAERAAIPVCGGVEAGQMVGRGERLPNNGAHTDWFLAVHAGPAVVARLAPWVSAYAGLDALVVTHRPVFEVRASRAEHRAAPAGIRFTLGIELHFPRRIRTADGMR